MEKVISKSTSVRGKNKRSKKKLYDFLLFVPLVRLGEVDLPVLNTSNHCICFTDKKIYQNWKDHYQMDIAKLKKYDSIVKIPRFIKTMMTGKKPKGLCLNSDPVTMNYHRLIFESRPSDPDLTGDIERIASFVRILLKGE